MKIIKALHPGLIYRTYSYHGKHYFSVSLLWGFRLSSGDPVMEQDLWSGIASVLGKDQVFDAGMPKANGEFVAAGNFVSPTGEAVGAGRVSIQLGALRKELAVFGDRRWIKGLGAAVGLTDPEPAVEIPITYANAFGGKSSGQNPVGKGLDPVDVDGETIQPLPNVEYFDQLIGSPGDRPPPGAFASVDLMWEPRTNRAGTYDKQYIEERMPGLPDDIDWRYFNDAASDQWFDDYPAGDESYEIRNMNAAHPVLAGRLPGLRGRCFVRQRGEGDPMVREVSTRLDTVWFVPNSDLGVLIHRGTIEVAEDDGSDLDQVIIGHENQVDPPREGAHYERELALRADPDQGFKYLMYTVPLLPEGCRCGFEVLREKAGEPLGLAQENTQAYAEAATADAMQRLADQQAELAERTRELGVDLGQALDKPVLQPSEEEATIKAIMDKLLPGLASGGELDFSRIDLGAIDELRAFTEQLTEDKKRESRDAMDAELARLRELGDEPGARQAMESLEQAREAMDAVPKLPRMDVESALQQMRDQVQAAQEQQLVLQSMGVPADQIEALNFDVEATEKQIRAGLAQAMDGYRMAAHGVGPASSPHPGREQELAEELLARHRRQESAAGGDYAFCEFRGRDLSGVDLSNALLEYADFTGADLSGANLEGAVLAYADLTDAKLVGSRLAGANLGATCLQGTHFVDCDLSGATLAQARLVRTRFERCRLLDRADMFLQTVFEQATFDGSQIDHANLLNLDLSGCRFDDADLGESHFVDCKLEGASFERARLDQVNFVNAEASSASFRQARMSNVRFVGTSRLDGADLTAAEAPQANFRECSLRACKFDLAHLDKTDFGGADLSDASFIKAVGRGAQFNKADLGGARFHHSDLMEGSVHKARLTGAEFFAASMYGVNLLGCTVGDTDFTDTYLEQTILKDWRPGG